MSNFRLTSVTDKCHK